MKALLVVLGTSCLVGKLSAQHPGTNAVEVVCTATNDVPLSLWVYKVVPQHFSPSVISNLLAMASFTMAQNLGTNGRWVYDEKDLNFETSDQKRHLWICQAYGYVEYRDYSAEAQGETLSIGVPSEAEAYHLALDYLRKFGIDRTQLATRASTNAYAGKEDLGIRRLLGTRGWTDKRTHKSVQDISEQGIFFVRRIDGVNMDGITHGGVFIGFGEHGKIAELKITWRGLEPFELQQTLTSAQIVAEIRQGLAKWGPNPPTGPIKRITVFGFEPFYRGQPGDADLEKQQRFVEPYVMICGSLGDGSTNDVKCFSEMPIFLKKRN